MRSPGFEPGIASLEGYASKLNWRLDRAEFTVYLDSKRYNKHYRNSILSHLDRYVNVIVEPMDLVRSYASLTDGQLHNLNRALSVLLKFYELKGVNPNYLNALRKALPRDNVGIDLYVPTEDEIVASLKKLEGIPLKYQAFYNLELDSGLRLTEAARLINQFDKAVQVKGFYRCTLGFFRGCKISYAGYFTPYTKDLIQKIKNTGETVDERNASHYFSKYNFVNAKYLRKFMFDTMISERFLVPESVADFLQGRTPKKIGARHYSKLLRQADGYYKRYADYLDKIRN